MQLHRVETHLQAVTFGVRRNFAIGGKQRQLAMPPRAFIKGFDQLAPSLMLDIVDLAQIQHLPLHHLATGAAFVLDNIPVAMLFAIFEASVEPQEHANQPTPNHSDQKDTWSTLQAIYLRAPLIRLAFIRLRTRKIVTRQCELVKLG